MITKKSPEKKDEVKLRFSLKKVPPAVDVKDAEKSSSHTASRSATPVRPSENHDIFSPKAKKRSKLE